MAESAGKHHGKLTIGCGLLDGWIKTNARRCKDVVFTFPFYVHRSGDGVFPFASEHGTRTEPPTLGAMSQPNGTTCPEAGAMVREILIEKVNPLIIIPGADRCR